MRRTVPPYFRYWRYWSRNLEWIWPITTVCLSSSLFWSALLLLNDFSHEISCRSHEICECRYLAEHGSIVITIKVMMAIQRTATPPSLPGPGLQLPSDDSPPRPGDCICTLGCQSTSVILKITLMITFANIRQVCAANLLRAGSSWIELSQVSVTASGKIVCVRIYPSFTQNTDISTMLKMKYRQN